jgi:Mn-dependent DtxR family transcriptional regulator
LRKQRNFAGYEGDLVTEAALAECLQQAAMLLARAEQRLREEGWIEREPR